MQPLKLKMKSALFILQIFVFIWCATADSEPESEVPESPRLQSLSESVKRFVQLTAYVHINGINEKYAENVQEEVIQKIDIVIKNRTNELIQMEIEALDLKFEVDEDAIELSEWGQDFQNEEDQLQFLHFQKYAVAKGQRYSRLYRRVELIQSLIRVAKLIRTVIKQGLATHLEDIQKGNLSPSQNTQRKQNTEAILTQLAPLVQKAATFTRLAKRLVAEDTLAQEELEAEEAEANENKQNEDSPTKNEENAANEVQESTNTTNGEETVSKDQEITKTTIEEEDANDDDQEIVDSKSLEEAAKKTLTEALEEANTFFKEADVLDYLKLAVEKYEEDATEVRKAEARETLKKVAGTEYLEKATDEETPVKILEETVAKTDQEPEHTDPGNEVTGQGETESTRVEL